jgi:glutathione S-transferase
MSELTLIIGNKNYSSWSLRPWLFMKHNGIVFREKRIALYTDATRKELQPYVSNFKVPVLMDKDFIVWDSLAILEYIAERFPDSEGWPLDAKARAVARSMSAEMHSSFVSLRTELPMNCRRKFSNIKLSADAQSDAERIKVLWRKCRVEYGAAGEWLCGRFSIVDAMYAPIALRFAGYGIPLSGIEDAYVRSILKHPAIIEWMEAGGQEREVLADYEKDTS